MGFIGPRRVVPGLRARSIAALCCGAVCALVVLAGPAAAAPPFLAQWGSLGTANGQFDQPFGIATDQAGNVYVADTLNHRIQKFSAAGAFITKWGTLGTGAGQFDEPRAVAVGPSGSVYVADLRNNRVQQFTPSGVFVRAWGWGVQTGAAEFQTCTSGCLTGRPGPQAGQFNGPVGIDTDPAGNVYVASQGGHNIQRFTADGGLLPGWGSFGSADGQFNEPYDVDADRFGNVYVFDGANSRIQKFTSTGTFLTKWGSLGTGPSQFQLGGGGLASASNGNVYVADQNNRRIQVFTPAGGFIESFSGPGDPPPFPTDVALDASDNVYLVNRFSHTVRKFGLPAAVPAPPRATLIPQLSAVAPPVLGRTFNVRVLKGRVLVSLPPGTARAATTVPGIKGRTFVPLRAARPLPVGSILDTRRGSVRLTSARDTQGATQNGDFSAGVFQVLQTRSARARGLTELRLKGASFRSCARRARSGRALTSARRVSRRRIRRLRANARGRFRTRGRYSSATVRGTVWTVTDRCDGTLTKVTRGRVIVRDLRRRRNISVRAGKRTRGPGGGRGSYLARPH